MPTVYKICPAEAWRAAERDGAYTGSDVDRRDGFIHLSTAAQLRATAARHFAGEHGLVLVALDADILGPALRYEPSRGGDLFPHLYGRLDPRMILWVRPLPLGAGSTHIFPDDLP